MAQRWRKPARRLIRRASPSQLPARLFAQQLSTKNGKDALNNSKTKKKRERNHLLSRFFFIATPSQNRFAATYLLMMLQGRRIDGVGACEAAVWLFVVV